MKFVKRIFARTAMVSEILAPEFSTLSGKLYSSLFAGLERFRRWWRASHELHAGTSISAAGFSSCAGSIGRSKTPAMAATRTDITANTPTIAIMRRMKSIFQHFQTELANSSKTLLVPVGFNCHSWRVENHADHTIQEGAYDQK